MTKSKKTKTAKAPAAAAPRKKEAKAKAVPLLINKHNLSVATCATKEARRYPMHAILVTPEETAATDGRILATVTTPKKVAPENFPAVPGFTPGGQKAVLLDAEAAKAIAAAIPHYAALPILENAAVSVSEDGNAMVAVTDLDNPRVFYQRKIEGQFPNYKSLLDAKKTLRIGFNPDYLMTVANLAKSISQGPEPCVILEFDGPTDVMRFTATNTDTEQKLIGLLMPMRV